MQDFKGLSVWAKAHDLALEIYRDTGTFPRTERFLLAEQMRRAAVSIVSNIAEGCGRGSDLDYARYLQCAMGSASELESQLLLARDLDYLPTDAASSLAARVEEVKRMLVGLMRYLRRNGPRPPTTTEPPSP
jgi:four helix bundle protein